MRELVHASELDPRKVGCLIDENLCPLNVSYGCEWPCCWKFQPGSAAIVVQQLVGDLERRQDHEVKFLPVDIRRLGGRRLVPPFCLRHFAAEALVSCRDPTEEKPFKTLEPP